MRTDDTQKIDVYPKTETCEIPTSSCSKTSEWLRVKLSNTDREFLPMYQQNIEMNISSNSIEKDRTITLSDLQSSIFETPNIFFIGGYGDSNNGSFNKSFPVYAENHSLFFKVQETITISNNSLKRYSLFFDTDYQWCSLNYIFDTPPYKNSILKIPYLKYYHLTEEDIFQTADFPSPPDDILLYIPFDNTIHTKNNIETVAVFSNPESSVTANFYGYNSETDPYYQIFQKRQYDHLANPLQMFSEGNYYHPLMRFKSDTNNLLCLNQCQNRNPDDVDHILTQLQERDFFSIEAWVYPEIPANTSENDQYISFIHFGTRLAAILKQDAHSQEIFLSVMLTPPDVYHTITINNNKWNHILLSIQFGEPATDGSRKIIRLRVKHDELEPYDRSFNEEKFVRPLNVQGCGGVQNSSPCQALFIGNWALNLSKKATPPKEKQMDFYHKIIDQTQASIIERFQPFNGAIEELMIFSSFREDYFQKQKPQITAQATTAVSCENSL